jgi:hypothetical protein
MKAKVYLETTFISYLAARQSRDLVIAANQQISHDWWDQRREKFDLYASELTRIEAQSGDADAASRRLAYLGGITELLITDSVSSLANRLIKAGAIPATAQADAIHIAIAANSGMDFLLTWNFKHLANAAMRMHIEDVCREAGVEAPVICSPQELLEDN